MERIEGKVNFGTYGGPPGLNESSPRIIVPEYDRKKSLGPNHSDSVGIDIPLFKKNEPIRKADIGIVISYRLGFTFWRQERIYHFVTQKAGDGYLHWFPMPLDN